MHSFSILCFLSLLIFICVDGKPQQELVFVGSVNNSQIYNKNNKNNNFNFKLVEQYLPPDFSFYDVEISLETSNLSSFFIKVNNIEREIKLNNNNNNKNNNNKNNKIEWKSKTMRVSPACVSSLSFSNSSFSSSSFVEVNYNVTLHGSSSSTSYLVDAILTGVVFLVIFCGIFYIEGMHTRKNKIQYCESERARNAYRRWVGLMSGGFFLYSFILISPASLEAISHSILSLFQRDIVAVLNALHGMFLFGVAIRGTTRPKILYFYLNFFIQSFMSVASISVALVSTVRFFRHHSMVGFEGSCTHQLRFPHFNFSEKTFPVLRLCVATSIYLECIHFIIYNIFIVGLRLYFSSSTVPTLESFVGAFISAYTTAIHKAVILNFGYNGAVEGYRPSLLFYVISTCVYAAFEPFAIVPLAAYQLPTKLEAIIPILMLFTGVVFKFFGVIAGYILYKKLPVINQQVEEGNEHFLSRTLALPWFIKGWTLAFAGCILLEAIILLFAQLDFMKGQLHVASMALNMGLHSAFLFTLCTYQNQSFTSLRMTRRFYMAAFTVFGAISFIEFVNGILALAIYDARTWQMGIWITIIFIRTFVEGGAVVAFSSIEQRIPKPHMEKEGETEEEKERENNTEEEEERNDSEHLVRRRAESGTKYEIEEITSDDSHNNSAVQLLMEGNEVDEAPLSPNIIQSGNVAKRWAIAFGLSNFFLCIFMVFTEVMDYSGMLVGFSSIAEMGGHTAPYECIYHFIILVTAFSVFGVMTKNSGFLHVASLIFTNLSVLAFLEIIVLILNYHTNINNIVPPSSSYQTLSILIMTWYFVTSCGAGYYLKSHSNLLISANINPEITVW